MKEMTNEIYHCCRGNMSKFKNMPKAYGSKIFSINFLGLFQIDSTATKLIDADCHSKRNILSKRLHSLMHFNVKTNALESLNRKNPKQRCMMLLLFLRLILSKWVVVLERMKVSKNFQG